MWTFESSSTARLIPAPLFGGNAPANGEFWVYIGTYTTGTSKGIYAYRLNQSGKLWPHGLVATAENPTSLAVHPSGRYLYATNELSEYRGANAASVTSYSLDEKTGALRELNRVSSRGANAAHLSIDKTGRAVLVANYMSSNAALFRVQQDGSLEDDPQVIEFTGSGPNKERQDAAHPHGAYFSPDNRFTMVTDLGTDSVLVHCFLPDLAVGEARPPARGAPGSGTRHLAFSPDSRFVYTIDELASTITGYAYDEASAGFQNVQVISTLPPDFQGENTTAEIFTSSDGHFLYGSNRGHDSLAVFERDSRTGMLKLIEMVSTGGKTPRGFGIDPTETYVIVANQDSDNIIVFRRDRATGRLTARGETANLGAPVCVVFVPAY